MSVAGTEGTAFAVWALMGGEFAQARKWNHDQSLDWHLLVNPAHCGVHTLVRDLNKMYRSSPSLHRLDCEPAGFEWIDASDAAQSLLSYIRHGGKGTAPVVVICNFTPVVRHGFRLGVPKGGRWIEKLNTNSAAYGGSNVGNLGGVDAQEISAHGRPFSLDLTLPPRATLVLERAGD